MGMQLHLKCSVATTVPFHGRKEQSCCVDKGPYLSQHENGVKTPPTSSAVPKI